MRKEVQLALVKDHKDIAELLRQHGGHK